MPPCPTTDPVACDDGNAQTAQQRYPCRSVPFPPCLALIEHKADPNYDAVATRMPATLGLAFVAHARHARGWRAQEGDHHQPLVLASFPCCTQYVVGHVWSASRGPRGARRRRRRPSRTSRAAPQGARRQARSGGVEALSTSTPRPTITVRMHSDNEPLSAYVSLSAAPKSRPQCSEDIGDPAHHTGTGTRRKADPH